ncbi:MAG TPA: SprT family zinc-dependent metalloprotease [Nitrososphaeraceae archaeon]|nr:SprT family zinc-dependent metalloprotease [Nitrososphaeraceae archaeon]
MTYSDNGNNSLLSSKHNRSIKNKSPKATKEIFQHGNNKILYNLVRSKRQKTSELIIENENEITLRVPFDKPLSEIKEIIQKKIQWILKKQDEYQKAKPEIKELSYLPSSTLPYLGNNYTIELRNIHSYTNTDSNRNSSSFNDNEKVELYDNKLLFYLNDAESYQNTNGEFIKNKIKQLYEKWLYEQAQTIFEEKIKEFSKLIEVNPPTSQVKKLKNRWGSLTKNKKKVLNINLLITSEKIIDYIIVHELCHMRREDHSHDFWSLLHRYIPDYQERLNWLNINGKILL